MREPPDDKPQEPRAGYPFEHFDPPADGQISGPSSRTAERLRDEAAAALTKVKLLSPREREVLDFIAQGLSIKEIAQSLAVSPKSVETYRARLLEKLEARTPTALMRLAVLVSLVAPGDLDGVQNP